MRLPKLFPICSVIAGSILTCSAQPADAQPADRATPAEDFFQRGNALLEAKDYGKACPLLAESLRLDPAGGTVQNLAICYEALGWWASAYAKFVDLRDRSGRAQSPRPDRVALANEHIKAIVPRLSRVVLAVDVEPGQRAPTVTIDDIDYQAASWSAGVLLDPGSHPIAVTAPGKLPFRTTVTITKDGSREGVRIPRLVDDPAARDGLERYRPDAGMRVPGLVVGGVGVAAVAGGVVFGILTITTNNAAKAACSGTDSAQFDSTGHCYSDSAARRDSNSKRDDARTFANLANILVPVGVVGIGAGLYLLLRSTRVVERSLPAASPSARLGPTLGGASLEGTF